MTRQNSSRTLLLIVVCIAATVLITIGVLSANGWLTPAPSRQAAVHEMGSNVMPFDLDKTTHIFEMNATGGIQQVIAQDPNDVQQIALIRQHVEHEAMRFRAGDFSDPTALHGGDMPGVQQLAAGATQMTIEYSALPNGAQISFEMQDIQLITAVHQWFGAQLSDHAQDAVSK